MGRGMPSTWAAGNVLYLGVTGGCFHSVFTLSARPQIYVLYVYYVFQKKLSPIHIDFLGFFFFFPELF